MEPLCYLTQKPKREIKYTTDSMIFYNPYICQIDESSFAMITEKSEESKLIRIWKY